MGYNPSDDSKTPTSLGCPILLCDKVLHPVHTKFDSSYEKREHVKYVKKIAETMEYMLECKEVKKIIRCITGSETLMSENKEELMTIYNYMERIKKTLT